MDEENLFNFINKKAINIILNEIKNEGNENAPNKLIEEENILETFVSQVLRYVMDLFLILLKNKNKCYALQNRSQLKDSKNINNTKNEDDIKNKFIRNFEVTSKVQKKRVRPPKPIQEVKLQKPIKRRGTPRKYINKSPEINKKRKFTESEDESDSYTDYDIKKKLQANKKKKHFKDHEELNESNFETNSICQVKTKMKKKHRTISRT